MGTNKTTVEIFGNFMLKACHFSEGKKPNKDNLINAISETLPEELDLIADNIDHYCKQEKFTESDIKEIIDYMGTRGVLLSVAKTRRANEDRKNQIKELANETIANISSLEPNDPDFMDKFTNILQKTEEKKLKIVIGAELSSLIYTKENFISDCENFDDAKNFKPKLFGKEIIFPPGSLSYIGARTGRGKTNSLVNIASEVLFEEADNKKKIVFLTFEMSCKQILNKIILSTTYRNAIKDDNDGEVKTTENQSTLDDIDNPARELYMLFGKNQYAGWDYKNDEDFTSEYNLFKNKVRESSAKILKLMNEKKLVLINGYQLKYKKIIDFIKAESSSGTLVLIDYIQKVRVEEKTENAYAKIQASSAALQQAALSTNAIIISAAQFNRIGTAKDGKQTNVPKGDVFSDESFRECGDLEQDAHNAIGIGLVRTGSDNRGNAHNVQTEDKSEELVDRFYEVLKTREGGEQGKKYYIKFKGKYSYMEQGEIKHDNTSNHRQKNKEGKNSNGTPGDDWGLK
jgi:hypothetical protein